MTESSRKVRVSPLDQLKNHVQCGIGVKVSQKMGFAQDFRRIIGDVDG